MQNEDMFNEFQDKKVCILGLGFVGLTLATVMSDVGFNVIGVEIRKEVVDSINSGNPHFHEPDLSTHLRYAIENDRLTVAEQIPENCDASVFIITVGTPLDDNGRANLTSIQNIAKQIAASMPNNSLVLLRSTVKLGTTRNVVLPILESSGKTFELAFCPERTVEGQALKELRYLPQIIGAIDRRTTNRAVQIFQMITPTVVRVSDFETAEMIKLIDNAKRDVIFAYANEVASLCDAVGISAEEVITSGRFGYSRTDLPLPGPVGGPCLSKDSHILAESVESLGICPQITVTARKVNEELPRQILEFIYTKYKGLNTQKEQLKICLLGFAFKGNPETDDIRGTTAIDILKNTRELFPHAKIIGYDPVVENADLQKLGAEPVNSLTQAFANADLIIIMNNHPQLKNMRLEELANKLIKPSIIYDFWNMFIASKLQLPRGVQYIALGSHEKPIIGMRLNQEELDKEFI